MRTLLFAISFVLLSNTFGQELKTDKGFISFFSEKESIKAENSEVISTLNVNTGAITFTVLIEKFIFPKSLMQKHFNQEGVMNSVKFPKAKFDGMILNNNTVDYTADGSYPVEVKGTMSIKGVSKEFLTKGEIVIKGGVISGISEFELNRFDYSVDAKEDAVSKILLINVKTEYK